MKKEITKFNLSSAIAMVCLMVFATVSMAAVEYRYATVISSTESVKMEESQRIALPDGDSAEQADIIIFPEERLQKIDGFGACFNELGWEALLSLSADRRAEILNDLFSKDGMNFNICRMPLGSNDYSLSYYSYNDVPEDFEMKNFNIDRDRYILIPYIKSALKINPELKVWASPWGPPAWMKVNNHYAMGPYGGDKNMGDEKCIRNNATAFKMQNRYLSAYALYFSKFVQAYKKEGVDIELVMVQNEPIYQPHWQSCTWRPEDLAYFIGKFLGPQFAKDSLEADIWLGTVNSADPDYMRRILNDRDAASHIKGIGVQWDAKHSIGTIHNEYPQYSIMQTESECGNGENNWQSAEYTWSLINKYLNSGANSYMYWNMVLDTYGSSSWGWRQNMMISIDMANGEVTYNPEYYLMKHISHYVLPGAYRLKTSNGSDHLAFVNPDGSIVVILVNTQDSIKETGISIGGKNLNVMAKAKSINTIVIK